MDIGGWLRSLGLEQYEAAFHANAVGADVLRDLTDQDLQKLGVPLGHRRKLLRAIAALDGALAPASAPRSTPLPIPPEAILAAAAAGASPERQQGKDHSVSPSPQPSPMSSRLRPAEMIGDRFLPSPEGPTLLLTASDHRHYDDIQTAETGDAYSAHDYHDDLPSPRWRDRLVMVIAVIALAGLGAVGTFAYRAVFAGAVLPALPPFIKAENAPNENVPNYGNDRPSDLSQTSIASDGSSEEFVSRWSADIQKPPKTAPISPNPSASPPSAPGSGAVAPIATAPAAPPPSTALTATSLPPKVAAPVPAPSSSTPKEIQTVISRSDGSGQTDTSGATAKSPTAKPSAAAPANDAAARAPEAKQTAAAAPSVGRPLSLAPDAHGHSAALPPSRSRMPAGTGTAVEASSGGGYAVAVASERSAADAEAVFRSLQAKFPNQLGGREPIVRRTDLGPEGIYYRASIGPFVSMKAAAGVCSSLKAAGESCLVEKN
jgi:SAM domain (Sterile alpha motif)/SPOR domain